MRVWRHDILGAAKLPHAIGFLSGKMCDAQANIFHLLGVSLRS